MEYMKVGGIRPAVIGLGCSRLGSMRGASTSESKQLIQHAIESGVSFFDTASSYGQGESERILGQFARSDDSLCIATKIGKCVPLKAKLLGPVKSSIRYFVRRSHTANEAVSASRGGVLPVCFDPKFLRSELISSLRRLSLESIHMVMLHSASANDLVRGDAMTVLESAKARGEVRVIGASVDDLAAAEAALEDPRIEAIQVPYIPGNIEVSDWARRAKAIGKLVIAREVFSGLGGISVDQRSEYIGRCLQRVTNEPGVGITLVGTTNNNHLDEILSLVSFKKS
jgi:aryl-alcohol dehydrogenase-like predicted oxidoreductase